ncbi:MAG TPA: oligosaccharide flippase family protein, partial [Solirubrobacteraceae bacterium]|nr:oligosaccharide flippase family protein [Solirubrobacteraceae bacterium]
MDEVASQPAPVGDGPSATTGRRAVLDVAVQVLGRVLNLVLGVVVTLVIARRLGDRGFGQWSTIFAVFQITAYFGSLGLERVAVGRAAAEPEQQSAWLGALVSLRLVIAIPVALVTAAVIGLVSETDAMLLAGLILCVNLLLNGLGATRAIFQLQVRNAVNVAVELANGILWGVAAILVAADRGGLVELAAAFVAVNVLTTGLQVGAALRAAPLHLRGSRGRWGELARIGIPVGIGGVLVLAYGRIDQILVFEIAGDRAAGLYGAVYRVLDRVQLVPESLMVTLFPLMAAAHGLDRQRVRHLFQLALDYMLVLSLPLLAFTVVAGRPLVVALFGSPFADAAPAMPVLMGAFVLICVGYLLGNVIIIVGLQGRLVRFAALALVV